MTVPVCHAELAIIQHLITVIIRTTITKKVVTLFVLLESFRNFIFQRKR